MGVKTMTETDISTKEKYYNYVNSTVESIIEEYENEYPLSEAVFDSVDSSNIVMYYSYNMDILQNSDNEPQEWKHFVSDNDYYKEVIQAMAFTVFRQDVWDKLHDSQEIEV